MNVRRFCFPIAPSALPMPHLAAKMTFEVMTDKPDGIDNAGKTLPKPQLQQR